jgi:hypothetical protein
LRSRLEFASCYVYSKRGTSDQALASRHIRDRLKQGFPDALNGAARRIELLQRPGEPLAGWFPADAILVPAPGSAPRVSGGLWVPERLSIALHALGVGAGVAPLVRRVTAVPKSAYSAAGSRPTVERHIASLSVDHRILPPGPLVIVDDVITKGRTLLAIATKLELAYPDREIRAFAAMRYRGFVEDIDDRIAPCIGTIIWSGGDSLREP